MQADAIYRCDADGARNDIFDLLQLALKRVVCGNDLLAVFVKDLPFASETKLLFAALDKQGFEGALERADLLADGRLGNTADLCGFGEALGFGEVTENLKAFDLHKNSE